MNHDSEREELLRAIRNSRRELDRGLSDVGRAVSLSERFESSIRKSPAKWIGGSVVAGAALALLTDKSLRESNDSRFGQKLRTGGEAALASLAPVVQYALQFSAPVWKTLLSREIENLLRTAPSRYEDPERFRVHGDGSDCGPAPNRGI
ncbi:MAG: hypothetical protein WD342_16510 [Verrucomicrobiales bacterium]